MAVITTTGPIKRTGDMTKLQQEIWEAICEASNKRAIDYADPKVFFTEKDRAKAAAEVAKKYIEEAYEDGWEEREKWPGNSMESGKSHWLKENGIV